MKPYYSKANMKHTSYTQEDVNECVRIIKAANYLKEHL